MKKENKKQLIIAGTVGFIVLTLLVLLGLAQIIKSLDDKDHMLISRRYFTATLLKDNTVLIVGGVHGGAQILDTAEIYDPKTHLSHYTSSLNIKRERHKAILLDDGRVLIVGGTNPKITNIKQAEIYDPKTGTFSLTGELNTNIRYGFLTLTKLKDGRIFVFGENQAEIYDSKTGKFKFVGNSKCNFDDNALALLPDGKVIIMGRASEKIKEEIFSTKEELISNYKSEGLDLNPKFIYKWFFLPNGTIIKTENFESKFKKTTSKVRTSEIYNPSTDKFTLGSNMVEPRINPKALTLKDGKILVLVGNRTNGKPYQDTEIYDPKFNKFVAVRKMEKQRSCGLSPVLFTDGRVYLVSNDYYPREQLFDWFIKLESTCEIYNPNNQSFKFTDKCIKPLKGGNIPILLPNEELLIFGGSNPRMSNLQERKIEIVDTKGIK